MRGEGEAGSGLQQALFSPASPLGEEAEVGVVMVLLLRGPVGGERVVVMMERCW